MKLSWDDHKRARTLEERGLDFADFALIDWDVAITQTDVRQDYGEDRYVTVAPINGRICVVAWCYRDGGTRIISMRKANERETKRYGEC